MEMLQLPHKVTLNERKELTATGVEEVVSFDEDTVILKTGLGTLVIHGKGLQLKNLSVESGQVLVEGTVSAMIYEEPRPAGGIFRRLFG